MVIDELITILSFDSKSSDKQKAEQYQEAIGKIQSAAATAAKWVAGLGASILALGRATAGSISENYQWAQSMGMDYEGLQRMNSVAEQFGGNIEDLKNGLSEWAAVSGGNLEIVLDQWDNIYDSVQGLPPALQKQAMAAANIPEPYIRAYQTIGKARIREMMNSAQVVSEEEARTSQEFMMTWRRAIMMFQQTITKAIAMALPAIMELVREISTFIDQNKEVISSTITTFFKAFAVALDLVFTPLFKIIGAFVNLVKWLDELTNGWFSMIVIIPILGALFATWIIGSLVSGITKTMQYVSAIGENISKLRDLAAAIKNSTLIQRIANAEIWNNTRALIVNSITKIKNGAKAVWAASMEWLHYTAVSVSTGSIWKQVAALFAKLGSIIAETSAKIASTIAEWAKIAAQIVSNVVTWLAVAAQWALNAALYACPFVWIIAAIMAVIAVIVLIIAYFEEIVEWLEKMWETSKQVFSEIGSAIKQTFERDVETAKNGWSNFVDFFSEKSKELKEKMAVVAGAMKENFIKWFEVAKNAVSELWDKIKNFCSAVKEKFVAIGNSIQNFFINIFNTIIDGVNAIIESFNKIPGVNISSIDKISLASGNANVPVSHSNVSNYHNGGSSINYVDNSTRTINTAATNAPAINRSLDNSRANNRFNNLRRVS